MTVGKSTGSVPLNLYCRYFEYARAVTDVTITEEGIFQKDQVPTDYGGARMDMEVVNAIYMVNSKAELQIFEFENISPMDADRKKDGRVERDGNLIRAAKSGGSSVTVVQRIAINDSLDDSRKALGQLALQVFRQALSQHPTEVYS